MFVNTFLFFSFIVMIVMADLSSSNKRRKLEPEKELSLDEQLELASQLLQIEKQNVQTSIQVVEDQEEKQRKEQESAYNNFMSCQAFLNKMNSELEKQKIHHKNQDKSATSNAHEYHIQRLSRLSSEEVQSTRFRDFIHESEGNA